MRLHVPALAGRPTTMENSVCAYSSHVRKFCRMMVELGHEVFLYGVAENDAPCTEHVACYSDAEEEVPFEPEHWLWREANREAARAIIERREDGDYLCAIAGRCQEDLARRVELRTIEYRVGYGGVFADFCVFESYAWMHAVYGARAGDPHRADGRFFDRVIYPPFETELFPYGGGGGDYVLYMGRLTERKGVQIASEAAQLAGKRLVLAGAGDYKPDYGECVGVVGPQERAQLLRGAEALLYPTIYVEPGGCAAIEAMMCGTPVISTDWGAFTETVEPGLTGIRCRMLREFVEAIDQVGELDRARVREHAIRNYSLAAIGAEYERYFAQLETLDGAGWYEGALGSALGAVEGA